MSESQPMPADRRPTSTAARLRRPPVARPIEPTPELAHDYGACRTLGHTWRHVRATAEDDARRWGGVPFRSRCEACGTVRLKWIARHSGALLGTTYTYPTNYQQHGETAPTRDGWRRAWVVQTMSEDE